MITVRSHIKYNSWLNLSQTLCYDVYPYAADPTDTGQYIDLRAYCGHTHTAVCIYTAYCLPCFSYINKCLWHMHPKYVREIYVCLIFFMVITQTHVQAVATVH